MNFGAEAKVPGLGAFGAEMLAAISKLLAIAVTATGAGMAVMSLALSRAMSSALPGLTDGDECASEAGRT